MTPEEFAMLDARIKGALEIQRRHMDGALARVANRLEQRARLQAQHFAQLHFGRGQVPEEVTNTIAKIWLE